MSEFIKKHIRPCGRISDQFLLGFIIAFLMTLLGQLLGEVIVAALDYFFNSGTGPFTAFFTTFCMYFAFIGIWIIMIALMSLKGNRPMLKTFGKYLPGNNLRMCLLGLLLGFGANAFCVVMSLLLKDLSLQFSEFNIVYFVLLMLAVFVQSAGEEIVMRCYYYEKLRRRYRNPMIALICTSVGFSVMHFANPNITLWGFLQILLIGITFAVLMHYYNSLWAPFLLHAAWNFTQSIFFGLPNSGIVVPYSNYKIIAASNGFFFDAGNGVEGSPGACIVIAVITVILIVVAKKRNLQPHDLWAEQEAQASRTA